MNGLKYICVAAIALLAIGCPARSVFPLFSEKELVFNKDLVGTWVGKDVLKIERAGEKSYKAIFEETAEPGQSGAISSYTLELGNVGKCWFLDSAPLEKPKDDHILSVHMIWKVQLEGDTLVLSPLESDRLEELINAGKLQIPHVKYESEILLTASTEELQKLVLQLADDEKAFKESERWNRKR